MKLGRPIILFFFPLAGSPHCTRESCLFRDAIELTPIFSDLQAIVIGISQDSQDRSNKFVNEHHLGYRILHDDKRKAMDLYGVSRTMMGMVDMRSTFIIDPSGIVRGVAEGVLNSAGHLKFAERWLIRLEDELSERSRACHEHVATEDDLVATMDKEMDKMIQVVYGDEGSASFGGIDVTPRYGATSSAPSKPPLSPSTSRTRASSEGLLVTPSKERVDRSAKMSTEDLHNKNVWKSWRYMLSQLSSPDHVPPPLVSKSVNRRDSKQEERVEETMSRAGSVQSKRSTLSSGSTSSKGFSRRSKSISGSKNLGRTVNDSPQFASISSRGSRNNSTTTEVDSDKEGNTNGTTDYSYVGSFSTAPSSLNGHSRHRTGSNSSKNGVSPTVISSQWSASIASRHSIVQAANLNKPQVTSEVLVGDSPIVTRIVPKRGVKSPLRDDVARIKEVEVNPSTALQRLCADSSDQPRRSLAPSDVPEDANPEEEDFSSLTPKQAFLDLHSDKSPDRTSALTEGLTTSRPSSTTGRKTRRVPPPVVSSYPSSWDSAYVKGEGVDTMQKPDESDILIRPMRDATLFTNPFNEQQSQQQAAKKGQSQGNGSTAEGANTSNNATPTKAKKEGNNLRSLPFVKSTVKSMKSKQTPNFSPSSPTAKTDDTVNGSTGSAISGPTNNNAWVLQSLQSTNISPKRLTATKRRSSIPEHTLSTLPMTSSSHLDDVRMKTIPRQNPPPLYPPPVAPAPSYAPPPPPKPTTKPSLSPSSSSSSHQHHEEGAALISGLPDFARRSSVTASYYDGYSSSNALQSSLNSRRPSIAESVLSNRTFG
ncbi:hypothetical protein CBS101457_006407 [Exobasidium rhododendri]|nr:hypothetical protein CBS101457_006407 [Exobasidium rhododendri]